MTARNLTIQALLAGGSVAAIVSTRVYPAPLPLKTVLPAIAVALSGEDEQYLITGSAQYPLAVVQVHCIASSATAADNLGETVKVYLRDLHFEFGGSQGSFQKSGPDFVDFDDLQTTHRRVMTFDLRWR